ncbi:hypothetical protein [Croceiramulus getboli]|nr:hypothetical protein P8624_10950 [Flavobacteriaceae bacterium YJPT1-3]
MTYFIVFIVMVSQGLTLQAQMAKVDEIYSPKELSYILSNIQVEKISSKVFYHGGIYAKAYPISDSKATQETTFEGYDGVLMSYYFSFTPDGDYYSSSRLYKIEGLLDPQLIDWMELKEADQLQIKVIIEHGPALERISDSFQFKVNE